MLCSCDIINCLTVAKLTVRYMLCLDKYFNINIIFLAWCVPSLQFVVKTAFWHQIASSFFSVMFELFNVSSLISPHSGEWEGYRGLINHQKKRARKMLLQLSFYHRIIRNLSFFLQCLPQCLPDVYFVIWRHLSETSSI